MGNASAAFSAPGKALLAGGYLVLIPEYSAYSVALSSRIHAVAHSHSGNELVVKSPQFASEWRFRGDFNVGGTHFNPFVNAVVHTVTAYFGNSPVSGTIEIWSDPGFHSVAGTSPAAIEGFRHHGKPITEVAKTGLGSSAALCTALTAALVYLHDGQSEIDDVCRIHNLAQVAHCAAQKKVGSGFDVATAVYGSIIYSRFDPAEVPTEVTNATIVNAVDHRWDMTITPVAPPATISFVLGDVEGGSETPGMVRQMLAWRAENPEDAREIWKMLNEANMALAHALGSKHDASELALRLSSVRKQLQRLTRESCVPVEPPEQTELLDRASAVEGVIGGLVPGAGGYDAVCLLVDSADVVATVERLSTAIPNVSWTHMLPEEHGLLREPIENYSPRN